MIANDIIAIRSAKDGIYRTNEISFCLVAVGFELAKIWPQVVSCPALCVLT